MQLDLFVKIGSFYYYWNEREALEFLLVGGSYV